MYNNRLIAFCLAVFVFLVAWQAIAGVCVPPSPPARNCIDGTHSSTFIARTSGLTNAQKDLYCHLINGLDADGTFSTIDVLYIYATNSSTTALLNLVSTSFTGTAHGTMTFHAGSDYQGDGSTGYIDTGYTPSSAGLNCTQNSCAFLAYDLSTGSSSQCALGTSNGGFAEWSQLDPGTNGLVATMNNQASMVSSAGTITSAKGQWVVSRTGANVATAYRNSSTTIIALDTTASIGLPNSTVLSHACQFAPGPSNFSADKLSAVAIGGGWTAAQAVSIMARINLFMTNAGVAVY